MNFKRRTYGLCALILFVGAVIVLTHCNNDKQLVLSDAQAINLINKYRPGKGAVIPADIKHRLGATHVDGKYYFTDKPFIIEGCQKLYQFGFRIMKLWFSKNATGYAFNSEWNLPQDITYAELAAHPYYKECFDMPFSTFALELTAGNPLATTDVSANKEEQEVYELTKYLLQTYADRDVIFILQNWEGDWVYRGGTAVPDTRWSRSPVEGQEVVPPADTLQRTEALIKWFSARQKGVERARMEVGSNSKCKVYHAVETNKVYDAMEHGMPGILISILPHVPVDMVSWSAYDGLTWASEPDNGLKLYRGVDFIKSKMHPSEYMNGEKIVFFGEIGMPEQAVVMDSITIKENWDAFLGVMLAQRMPYMFMWELYCNEPKDRSFRHLDTLLGRNDMEGYWLIRPDGTESYAGEFFSDILSNAGGRLSMTLTKNQIK